MDNVHLQLINSINSNLEKLENLRLYVNGYYEYVSNSFFSNFDNEQLSNFKKMKDFLDKVEINITNFSNNIMAHIIQDERLKEGVQILINESRFLHIKELEYIQNLQNTRYLRYNPPAQTSQFSNLSNISNLVSRYATNPINLKEAIKNYNDTLLIFRAIQTEQYTLMGNLEKALKIFFNFQNSSRELRNKIIQLDLKPIVYIL